jgi:hypothetical protein
MIYTEWLRVRGALKWTIVALGIVLVLAGIARLATFRYDATHIVADLQNDSDSKVSSVVLPDGTKRTIIVNDRRQIRATVDDRGYDGQHIDIIDRSSKGEKYDSLNAGAISVRTLKTGDGRETIVDTNAATFFGDFTVVALVISLIVATILGAPFAKENDGHLEIALTKPVDRTLLALRTMLLDCGGVLASFIVGIVFAAALHSIFQSLRIQMTAQDVFSLAVGAVAPLAWYAMLAAITASMKRGYGMAVGFAWPIGLAVIGLANIPGGAALRDALRAIFGIVSYIDPFKYMNVSAPSYTALVSLAVLALVYGTLAAIQWRRVEA